MPLANQSVLRSFGAKALGCLAVVGLALSSCSSSVEKPSESFGVQQSAIIPLEAPTTVESGTPSPRQPKCPAGKLPDQCGSWAGVELKATRAASSLAGATDEHCLCGAIDFAVPTTLPATLGKSGGAWDQAQLSFRTASGSQVQCRYRGNDSPKYVFDRCSDGSKPGQAKRSDWLKLELAHGLPGFGATEVQLRLGEPDVVDGVVQEQVFYADDSRIPGAALHVPRGSAPAFENFSLAALNEVPLGTAMPNANDPATSISFAVDVHADSSESFVFTPVAGAACARIELPYDQATLDRVAGPGGEATIQAHQLTTLTGITSGAQVLTSAGPVIVDLARRTFSFCVEHLSFYVGISGNYSALVESASVTGATIGTRDLMGGDLPLLTPGETYQLSVGFTRSGSGTPSAWTSGGSIYLVNVGTPEYFPTQLLPTVYAVPTPTDWGNPVSTNVFSGGDIQVGDKATFTIDITCPIVSKPLNLCLRYALTQAEANDPNTKTGFFGHCFTWDINDAGTHPVPVAELCDGEDNDDDGFEDEDLTRVCYTGPTGTLGRGACEAGVNVCGALPANSLEPFWGDTCEGETTPTPETCGDGVDNDCDGNTDNIAAVPCYDGPSGTADVGECRRGTRACVGGAVVCVGQILPSTSRDDCNGKNDDCDGDTDEDGKGTYYLDRDGDSFGDSAVPFVSCTQPPSFVTANGDCCDFDNRAKPTQESYFTTPNVCGNYEYNCRDGIEQRFGDFVTANGCIVQGGLLEPNSCAATSTSNVAAPACGTSSVKNTCRWLTVGTFSGACLLDDDTIVQECR